MAEARRWRSVASRCACVAARCFNIAGNGFWGAHHAVDLANHGVPHHRRRQPQRAWVFDQCLVADRNRDPAAPFLDTVTVQGDIVVPVNLVNFGHWLRLLLGAPTTTGTAPNLTHSFGSGAAALPSQSIEIGYPDAPTYDLRAGASRRCAGDGLPPDSAGEGDGQGDCARLDARRIIHRRDIADAELYRVAQGAGLHQARSCGAGAGDRGATGLFL